MSDLVEQPSSAPRSALDGIEVLELGSSVASSYCAKLLADLGATVHKWEPPDGDPIRRFAPCDTHGSRPMSGLFHYLNANKRSVAGDLRDPVVATHVADVSPHLDIVVDGLGPGELEALGLDPASLHRLHPALVVVRISDYGQSGPWRDRVASDLTLQAECGMALRLGDVDGPPVSVSGRLSEYVTGVFAASAALAALEMSRRTGAGEHIVDVSRFESLLCSLSPVDVLYEFLVANGITPPGRQRVSPGFVQASDGPVCVSTLTAQNWNDLCVLIEHVAWTDRMNDVQNDGPARAEFLGLLGEWAALRPCQEIIDLMQAFRIAASMAADGRTLLQQPPFVERDFYVRQPGASFLRPAAPYRLSATPVRMRDVAPPLGAHQLLPRSREAGAGVAEHRIVGPLAGTRVVDLTTFLSGGHLTGCLAALGADVIKVESPRRPDAYRFVQAFPSLGEQWWERSPLWQAQNMGKKSLTLDLANKAGRDVLAQLISSADVVAENFTTRVVESFGFAFEQVHQLNPRAVMVRMPAFGLEGPWRDHAGFAYNIEQVAGMAQSGVEGGPFVQPAGIADIVNGQHALVATLAALRDRDRFGTGQLIEVSQAEALACLTAEDVIEFQLTGAVRPRLGNRDRARAPQGIYPCAHGRWVAISVADDSQWRELCREVSGLDPHLAHEDRWRKHDEIDASVHAWAGVRPVDTVVAVLQARGIAAGALTTLDEIIAHPHLAARGYHRSADHPVAGRQRVASSPVSARFDGSTAAPAPTLGQHNIAVLADLGLSAETIDDLAASEVIADHLLV